jgi:hypothetical protein
LLIVLEGRRGGGGGVGGCEIEWIKCQRIFCRYKDAHHNTKLRINGYLRIAGGSANMVMDSVLTKEWRTFGALDLVCFLSAKELGRVWIGAKSSPAKNLVVDRAWALVWMSANKLARPDHANFLSSIFRQLLGESWVEKSCANFLARPRVGRATSGSIQTHPWFLRCGCSRLHCRRNALHKGSS